MSAKGHFPIFIALASFVVIILCVDPRGDFPLNDDWDFASTSWQLARSGNYEVGRYTAVSLRTQAIAGAIWTRLFGESFTALRLLTLFAMAGSLLLLDRILRHLGASGLTRTVLLLTWLGSPLTLVSAFSFMTHIYAATLLMAATLLLFRGYGEQKTMLIVAGATVALLAVLVRQNAVVWFVALIVSAFPERKARNGRAVIAAACGGLLAVGIMIVTTDWLTPGGGQFTAHASATGIEQRWWSLGRVVTAFPQHAALTFLPLVIPFAWMLWRERSLRLYAMLAGCSLLFLLRVPWMPGASGEAPAWSMLLWPDVNFGNVFTNFALGPPTLTDVGREGYAPPFTAPLWLRVVVTALGVVGGAVILVGGVLTWRTTRTSARVFEYRFIATFLIAGVLMLSAGNFYFDRYVVDVAWPLLLLATPLLDRFRKVSFGAIATAAAIIIASTMGVAEYLAWNEARWALVERAMTHGVNTGELDGGYEVNAWLPRRGTLDLQAATMAGPKRFMITFHSLPGARVIDREDFGSFRRRSLYLIEAPAKRRVMPAPRQPRDAYGTRGLRTDGGNDPAAAR